MDPNSINKGNKNHNSSQANNKRGKHNASNQTTGLNSSHGNLKQLKKPQNVHTSNHYDQPYVHNYPSWGVFNETRPRKGSYNQVLPRTTSVYNSSIYSRNLKSSVAKGYLSANEKNFRSTNTTAASSDGENNVFQELSGFRIVHNGKVIHNEILDETPGAYFNAPVQPVYFGFTPKNNFASSEFTMGPNSKEISIPIFVEI